MALSCGEPPVPPAPYDAQVEYVDCNGTYVDTGVALGDYTIVAEMQMSNGYVNDAGLLGAWMSRNNWLLMVVLYNNKYYFGTSGSEKNVLPVQPFDTGWHTYTVSARGLFQVDSDVLYNTAQTANLLGTNCFIFARNYTDSVGTTVPAYCSISPAGVRCRSFRIIDNATGDDVFNAISVRVGTVGYLYDQVSGTLKGGAGNDLVPGNDVI